MCLFLVYASALYASVSSVCVHVYVYALFASVRPVGIGVLHVGGYRCALCICM